MTIPEEHNKLMSDFWLRDDVSRISPAARHANFGQRKGLGTGNGQTKRFLMHTTLKVYSMLKQT